MPSPLRAILFDLDGTLLHNHMDAFLPPYFQRIGARFAHLVPPDQFVPRLIQATQIMLANDGSATNQEVFSQVFPPLVQRTWAEMEPIFLDFYTHDFPALQSYTRPNPDAPAAVVAARDRGYDIVIATNPLFPEIAIRQRLAWAGLADGPFRHITTYENSRACKPNLLYFQHLLDLLQCPAEACLVVGDEDMDMVAAHLGCPTFLVPGPATKLKPTTPAPTYSGSLADVAALLPTLAP